MPFWLTVITAILLHDHTKGKNMAFPTHLEWQKHVEKTKQKTACKKAKYQKWNNHTAGAIAIERASYITASSVTLFQ